MPAFLNDFSAFLGTGEKNEDNQTLGEFLDQYDPYTYKNPSVTADVLVIQCPKGFNQVEEGLKLLMVKRRNHPSIGYWALPGGFINIEEDMEAAAKRELEEETGLTGLSIEMVNTYGEANRDPRARIITVAYVALVDESLYVQAGDDAADACFVELSLRKLNTLEEECNEKAKEICTYELKAVNEEKGLELSAIVERSRNKEGLLKETAFKVIEVKGIAFDHPRFIVETMLYLKRLLGN